MNYSIINYNNIKKVLRGKGLNLYYKYSKPCFGINTQEKRHKKIIISLTSYPARLNTLHLCIKSLMNQTYKPDKIILYLGEDTKRSDIGSDLIELKDYGLTIITDVENLGPHKKYYYAIKEYPNDIIITVDDDVIYDELLVESLIDSYNKYPNCVSARRVHKILTDSIGKIRPYNSWQWNCKNILDPSKELFATGVGGVLYPPGCLNSEVFNKDNIKKLCMNADDVWLKFMEIMNDTAVAWVNSYINHPAVINGTQGLSALNKSNVLRCQNDVYIEKMSNYFQCSLLGR